MHREIPRETLGVFLPQPVVEINGFPEESLPAEASSLVGIIHVRAFHHCAVIALPPAEKPAPALPAFFPCEDRLSQCGKFFM